MEIRLSNGTIINEYGIKAAFPATSWPVPESITPEMLEGTDAVVVQEVAEPTVQPYQSVSRDGIELVDSVWHQKWLVYVFSAEEIAEYDEAERKASIPQAVTMRQARLALLAAGKLAGVNAAIADMTGAQGDAARIEWEFSSEVKRGQPLVMALGPALGMSEAQLDSLFTLAATL